MWVFPLGAAIVSGLFAASMGQQFVKRGRPHQLAWSVALLMFFAASFAAAMGMIGGWNTLWFGLYYYLGAIMTVPVLALGSIYLLTNRIVGHVAAAAVVVAALVAVGMLLGADLETARLAATKGIPTAAAVAPDTLRDLSRYYSYTGYFIVVLGALWSAARLAQSQDLRLKRLALGNLLIAAGTTLVALASVFVRYGRGAVFSVGLLAGVSVMYAGFLKTRPPSEAAADPEAVHEPSADPQPGTAGHEDRSPPAE